jgi:D-3-phosphoglycerate dehydrogenase / 2-oxoglutarate reductase
MVNCIAITTDIITDCEKEVIEEYIEQKGYHVEWIPLKVGSVEIVRKVLKGYRAIIAGGEFYNSENLKHLASDLKIISRLGIGYDKIDINAATSLGIAVANAHGTMAGGVAEAALLLILNAARRFHHFDNDIRKGKWWNLYDGTQLEGKTVGLIGFGKIAQKLAQYLAGFSCRIIAFDKFYDQEALRRFNIQKGTLEVIAKESDYISIHIPLNDETRELVNANFLKMMKPNAYLINTSRGQIVKEVDLIQALQNGIIAGAGLDVFEKEPIDIDNPLIKMDQVILTPHVASRTMESIIEAGLCAADNVIDFLMGKMPKNLLNPEYSKYINRLK